MRGGVPKGYTAVAAGLGVAVGIWPALSALPSGGGGSAGTRTDLVAALADHQWEQPKPGSWTPPKPSADGLPPVISKIDTQDRVVFLTIDDGYEYDPEFVNIVRNEKVPILTFLTTTYVRGHGQYFWALRNAGSRMENHTVTHPDMKTLSLEGQQRQICQSSDTIATQYGRRPEIFRPPFGSYTPRPGRPPKRAGSSRS